MLNRGKPINQIDIEDEMIRLIDMLEDQTDVFAKLAEDEAEAEAEYKSNWAKLYLKGTGSIKERESWATYQLETELRTWRIAEALVKAKREKLTSLRTSIDALRTLNANVRHQV